MLKNFYWLVLMLPLVVILSGCALTANRLSHNQALLEKKMGNGLIHLKDLNKNFEADVQFKNKQAEIAHDNQKITYTIKDILQPYNIDNQGPEEYPFLLEADYQDGKKLDYLVISRYEKNKFQAIDQIVVGDPAQIGSINELDDKEVVVEASWGEGADKEDVHLTYTFQADKIVPDKNNIDITKPKPKPTPTPTPTATKTATPAPTKTTSSGDSGKGKVALTFDDGPGVHTPEVLSVLADKGVNATFFMIGENAESRNDYVRRVHDAGHLIGNHTYDHQDLKKLSYDAQYDEINKTNKIINGIIGLSPHYMRPPYGNYNDDTKSVLTALGMEKVLWNVDTRDWSGLSADQIKTAALAGVKDGAIILMHDGVANSSETAKALPGIIDEIKNRGYQMVKLSEL